MGTNRLRAKLRPEGGKTSALASDIDAKAASTGTETATPLSASGVAKSFGTAVVRLRQRRQLTQGQLGDRLALTASMVSRIENGERNPTRSLLLRLGKALELTTEERNELAAAAGYPLDELTDTTLRVVEIVSQQVDFTATDRSMMLNDLVASIQGWRKLSEGRTLASTHDLEAAKRHYAGMADHSEYTPMLRAYSYMLLADAEEKLGELDHAETHVQTAMRIVQQLPLEPTVILQADIFAVQGKIALRKGQYSIAGALMEKGKTLYSQMRPDSEESQRTILQGQGESCKRLALLSLFRGKPEEAQELCGKAEGYLRQIDGPGAKRNLLAIEEFRAWALSLQNEFAQAHSLYSQVQQRHQQTGDTYGVSKIWLYIADNYHRELKVKLGDALDATGDSDERRRTLSNKLKSLDHLATSAKEAYERALGGAEQVGERILRGRCLSGLGDILRLQAAQSGEAAAYARAQQYLDQALALESEIGQARRIPGIYESLARLERDQGRVQIAIDYYQRSLQALAKVSLSYSADDAADRMRERIQRALQALQPRERASTGVMVYDGQPVGSGDILSLWRTACDRLIEVTREFVLKNMPHPTATWELDPDWIQLMCDLEEETGSRVLLQNRLSTSLSQGQPPNLPPDASKAHSMRHRLFVESVRESHWRGNGETIRDLCCRSAVEADLRDESGIRDLVQGQATKALELMRDYRGTYQLESCVFEAPLSFAVKGGLVLFEIPGMVARQLLGVQVSRRRSEDVKDAKSVCYAIGRNVSGSAELAHTLVEIFDQLVVLAGRSLDLREPTLEWLAKMTTREPFVQLAISGF